MSENKLSRRSFLKASALTAAGMATMGAAGALAEEKKVKPIVNEPEKWDYECDVLAIGTGTSMYGVIKAANAGLDVICIDSNTVAGGAAGFSGAALWLPANKVACEQYGDSREKAVTYLKHGIRFSNTNEEDIDAFLDNIDPMLEFIDPMLRSTSYDIGWVVVPNLGDYHASWEGGLRIGRSVDWRKGKTTDNPTDRHAWRHAYLEAAEREGAKIMLQTTARKFVFRMQEDDVPEVLGVIAEQQGKTIAIKAKKAVLLASGGFEWNESHVKDFVDNPELYPFSFSTNKGYGLEMAMSVGSRLTNMSRFWGSTTLKDPAERFKRAGTLAPWLHARYKPHSMMVNKTGRRFMNEACDYNTAGKMFNRRESYLNNELENMPCWMVFDQQHIDNGFLVTSFFYEEKDERGVWPFVKKADTLEELAEIIGVPKENLVDEVARFNGFVKNGKDEDFHRGEDPHDLTFFQNANEPWENVYRTLGTIEQGPFYAVEIAVMTLGTCGGPKIDKHAQVEHISGKPVGRFYACGNVTGFGGPGDVYGGAGGTLGPGFVMGFAAASHIVDSKLEDWE